MKAGCKARTTLTGRIRRSDILFKIIDTLYAWKHLNLPSRRTPVINEEYLRNLASEESVFSSLIFGKGLQDDVCVEADRVYEGYLDSCNSPIRLDGPAGWFSDGYSGYTWDLNNYRLVNPHLPGTDSNIPLETSRLHFIMPLIKAHRVSGDVKYQERCISYLRSWIESNPYPLGINWYSGLDVAVRAMNMLLCLAYLGESMDAKLRAECFRVLWRHAEYIYRYDLLFDRKRYRNNHFLGAMVGLLALSMAFSGVLPDAYYRRALENLRVEIKRQFHKDGGNFESATGYHQFSLEACLMALSFLSVNTKGDVETFLLECIGEDGLCRIVDGTGLVNEYMNTFQRAPNIGDSSDSRVFIFGPYAGRDPTDHGFLLDMAEIIPVGWSRSASVAIGHYPDSGYAFYRNELYGLVAFAGPKGTSNTGGHGHNDKCSFVLQVLGQPVLVDSGTFIYDTEPAQRLTFKRGKAHNTLTVDGLEQCEISEERVFGLQGDIHSRIERQCEGPSMKIIMAHDGFCRVGGIGEHKRIIQCNTDEIILEDYIEGNGQHQITFYFNMHPYIKCARSGNMILLSWNQETAAIIFPRTLVLTIEDSHYSDRYRHRMKNQRLVASSESELPVKFRIRFLIDMNTNKI